MATITYDTMDLDFEWSMELAKATKKYGFNNCHNRAAAAYKAAPKAMKPYLHVVKGLLFSDEGLDGAESCEHSFLLWVDEDYNSAVLDPSLAAVIDRYGMPTGIKWQLSDD